MSVVEEEFEALASTHLALGAEETCLQSHWVAFCKEHLKDARQKRDFLSYLERRHGLRLGNRGRRTVRTKDGSTASAYRGFRLKSRFEQEPLL